MISTISLLFSILILGQPSFSQELNPSVAAEDYRWLYEILIPEADRQAQPNRAFKSFRVHLADSFQKFPRPEHISASRLRLPTKVTGQITYVSIVRKKYAYDILPDQNGFVIRVRIHLKNPTATDRQNLTARLKTAEDNWNTHRVQTDFSYSFQFEFVDTASLADFSVQLLDSTRGPYDTSWGRNWSATTISHEVGHMLGLGDEYQTITSESDCLDHSLMCDSNRGQLMGHHYYFILRRLIN